MFLRSLDVLCCPKCGTATLGVHNETLEASDVMYGFACCTSCGTPYPILDGVAILSSSPREYVCRHRASILGCLLGHDIPSRVTQYLSECISDAASCFKSEIVDESECIAYIASHFPEEEYNTLPPESPIKRFYSAISAMTPSYWDVMTAEISGTQESGTIVDAGCSVGGVLHRCNRVESRLSKYLGFDIGFAGVRLARSRALRTIDTLEFEFCVADCTDAIPIARSASACVVASNMIDVTPDPLRTVRVLSEKVMKGGKLIISSPWYWQSSISSVDSKLWSRDSSACLNTLIEHVTNRGEFEVASSHSHIAWPLVISDRHLRLFLCDIASFLRVEQCQ